MANLLINNSTKTIVITTKKFAAAASRYGSDAYGELQAARKDYPNYRVVTKTTRTKKVERYNGLTYEFMENYIKQHDEDGAKLAEFYDLRATSEEAIALGAVSLSYGEIKSWFFQQYPAFAEFQKKREKTLAA